MRKRCNDPVCPANQPHPSSHKSKKRTKTKKQSRPSTSKSSKSRRSTCTRSKRSSREQVVRLRKRSCTRTCKNKKCQASRITVESSTSVSSIRDEACNPRKALKRTKSRRHQQSRCKSPSKKRHTALCICVRGSSSQNLRNQCTCPSKCTILSKYDDCCCLRHKKDNHKRRKTLNATKKPQAKCHCKPPIESRSRGNMFMRGLSSLRKKIHRIRNSFTPCEEPRCNEPRVCRKCPIERCCSRNSLRNQNHKTQVKRKVKFH